MRSLSPPPADARPIEAPGTAPAGLQGPGAAGRERPRPRPRLGRRLLVALLLAGVLPVAVAGYLT